VQSVAAARAYGTQGANGTAARSAGDASASILRKAGSGNAERDSVKPAVAASDDAAAPLEPIGNVGRRLDIRL
jgi:hypothetical protein